MKIKNLERFNKIDDITKLKLLSLLILGTIIYLPYKLFDYLFIKISYEIRLIKTEFEMIEVLK